MITTPTLVVTWYPHVGVTNIKIIPLLSYAGKKTLVINIATFHFFVPPFIML
jgi:hypothetical protein